jgi:transcription initiation factor IIF auxiliary subunit
MMWTVSQIIRQIATSERANQIFPADGEFHVDLYTLPDQLIKMLWDFTSNRVNMNELA